MEVTSKRVGVIAVSALILAVLACIVAPRLPYHSSDLMIYNTSLAVAGAGGNPYNPVEIREALKSYIESPGEPVHLMWNPPGFLIYPGLLLLLPQPILYDLWPAILVVSVFALAIIGAQISGIRESRAEHIIFAASASLPFLVEIKLSQLSSIVSLLPIFGMLLYLRGANFISGVLLSFGVLKPHAVFLPLCVIALWTLHERRWQVLVGAAVGLLCLLGLSEAVFPGLNQLWLHRASWPVNIVGSAIPGLLRLYLIGDGYYARLLGLLWSCLGVAVFALISWRSKWGRPAEVLVWAIMLNPIVTPYGFMFDQSVLVVAQAFWLMRFASIGEARLAIGCITVSNIIPLVLNQTLPSDSLLWTATYPLALVAGISVLRRKLPQCCEHIESLGKNA